MKPIIEHVIDVKKNIVPKMSIYFPTPGKCFGGEIFFRKFHLLCAHGKQKRLVWKIAKDGGLVHPQLFKNMKIPGIFGQNLQKGVKLGTRGVRGRF